MKRFIISSDLRPTRSSTVDLTIALCFLCSIITPLFIFSRSLQNDAPGELARPRSARLSLQEEENAAPSLLYRSDIRTLSAQEVADRRFCRPSRESVVAFEPYRPRYKLWKDQLLPLPVVVQGCVGWKQTISCNSSHVEQSLSRNCDAVIRNAPRGYCMCDNDLRAGRRLCGGPDEQSNFTCREVCAEAVAKKQHRS